tara:strand:+ start:79 stop:480 length:402 start_codon:yes stop_codon:yes gene_type:complete
LKSTPTIETYQEQTKMSLLRKLPTDVINLIYSFDDNKRIRQNKNIYVAEIKHHFKHYKMNYNNCVEIIKQNMYLYNIYESSKRRKTNLSISQYLLKRNDWSKRDILLERTRLEMMEEKNNTRVQAYRGLLFGM